jgi:methylated-DNA-[protein]-cysteine S-methyltransferase
MLRLIERFPTQTSFAYLASPMGKLCIIASYEGVHALLWENELKLRATKKALDTLTENERHPVIKQALKQLGEYFNKTRKSFDLPLKAYGTVFQKSVWKELSRIPYGQTISYGEHARRLGDAKKARAVGTANGKNPLSILVPCHRVISATGALGGFGGGIDNKKFLLALEQP